MKAKNQSFTLIELLVVIVIIGILAGVIMISTSSSINKANIAKLKVFEESMQNNLAANMVSAWDADHVAKGTTWILNDKWGSNNGTFYDGTLTTCSSSACPQVVNDKQMGNVLSFDGVNDYISISNSNDLNILDNITVSAWIKQDIINHSDYHIVLKSNSSYGWFFGTVSGKIAWLVGKENTNDWNIVLTGGILVDGWNYIIGTYNHGWGIIYLNGTFVGDSSGATESCKAPGGFRIGLQSENNYAFKGLINDVRIYNAALSSAQIKQNYVAGLNSMLANGNISKQEYNERINALAYDNE